MIAKNPITNDLVATYIQSAIKQAIEQEYDAAVKHLPEILEQRKAEVVAGILVSIMKTTDMRVMQDSIVFTIRTSELKK